MIWRAREHPRTGTPGATWTLVLASLGFGLITLQTTAVNVALPALDSELGGGVEGLQWVVNAYAIAFASTLLPLGALADRVGARRIFIAGLAGFAFAEAASAVAPALGWLIAGQAVAGVSGAMVAPASMALVGDAFTHARERTHAIGLMSLGIAGGFGAGPVVGGVILAWFGWRSVFLVNVPFALALIATVRVRVAAGRRRAARRPDTVGVALGVLALGSLTFAVIEGGHHGWDVPGTCLACATAALGGLAFVASQRAAVTPLVPGRLFAGREIPGAAALGMILNFAIYGELFFLSLYLQRKLDLSALETGLLFLPQPIGTALVAPRVARGIARTGPRTPLLAGLALSAASTLILWQWGTGGTLALTAVGLFFTGVAGGMIVPALNTIIVVTSPRDLVGVASGMFNAARQVGSVLGVAVLGTVAGSGETRASVQTALLAGAAIQLAGVAIAARVVGRGLAREPRPVELPAIRLVDFVEAED